LLKALKWTPEPPTEQDTRRNEATMLLLAHRSLAGVDKKASKDRLMIILLMTDVTQRAAAG